MEGVPKGPGRLQAVREELTRLQTELEETEGIRKEAEVVNDPELTAECTAAETRLRGLIAELSAEVTKLQKGSGAEALRARLQQLKTSEARARSVLGSGEIPASDVQAAKEAVDSTQPQPAAPRPTPLSVTPQSALAGVSSAASASASPKSTQGQLQIGSPLRTASPSPSAEKSPRPAGTLDPKKAAMSAARHNEALPSATLTDAALGRQPQSTAPKSPPAVNGWDGGFGESAGFGEPSAFRSVPSAPSAHSSGDRKPDSRPDSASEANAKTSEVSMEVNRPASQTSLDSFADSTFGGSTASKPKPPPRLSNTAQTDTPSGFESNAFGKPVFGQPVPSPTEAPVPKATSPTLGFGDSAFNQPSANPSQRVSQPTRPGGEGLGMEEKGKSISFKDSFLKDRGAPMPKPILKLNSDKGSWQAFDAQKAADPPKQPVSGSLGSPSLGKPKASGSSEFESSAFGAFGAVRSSGSSAPSRSATVSPSARSGNPFQDFGEPAGPETATSGGSDTHFAQGIGQPQAAKPWQLPTTTSSGAFDSLGPPSLGPRPVSESKAAAMRPAQPHGPPAQLPGGSAPTSADPFASGGFLQPLQYQQPPPEQFPQPASEFGSFDPFSPAPPQGGAQGFGAQPPPPAQPGAFAAASVAPGSAPIRLGPFPIPSRQLQAAHDPFSSNMPSQPGSRGFAPLPAFRDPQQPFVVTPSMVIPEADWDAAFAPARPVQASAAALEHQPLPQMGSEEEVGEDLGDPSVWVPMTDHDRARCEQAFKTKAKELWTRAEISQPLEAVFLLADVNKDGKLGYVEFLLYMYLLKVLRKGAKLPKRLSDEQITQLLGIDAVALKDLRPKKSLAPEPAAVHVATTSPLQALISLGATEEDAKRALFLNGEDVNEAEAWLRERKLLHAGGSRGGAPAALKVSFDEPSAEAARLSASSATRQPGSARSADSDEGGALMAVKIEKALLQYKKPVDRPLFQVVLRDSFGKPIEPEIDTPPCTFEKSAGVFRAGHSIVFRTAVEKMPENAVVYFELKHWKSKEKKWSTLGWTFVHKESFIKLVDGKPTVRTEAQGLHLYEKPMDPESHFRQKSMRKLKPLSETPDLFLRVSEYQRA